MQLVFMSGDLLSRISDALTSRRSYQSGRLGGTPEPAAVMVITVHTVRGLNSSLRRANCLVRGNCPRLGRAAGRVAKGTTVTGLPGKF